MRPPPSSCGYLFLCSPIRLNLQSTRLPHHSACRAGILYGKERPRRRSEVTTEDRKDSHRGGQRIVFEGHERKSDEVGRSLDARIKDNQSERRQRDSDRRGRDSSPMRRSRRPERRLDDGRSATHLSIFSCSLSCFTVVSSLGGRSPEYPFHCRDDLPVRGMYSDRGSRQDRERDRDRDRGGYGDRRGSGRTATRGSPLQASHAGLPCTLQVVLRHVSQCLHRVYAAP